MILSNKRMTDKGVDQTARMRRQVCAFVVRKPPKTGFIVSTPISNHISISKQNQLLQELPDLGLLCLEKFKMHLFEVKR